MVKTFLDGQEFAPFVPHRPNANDQPFDYSRIRRFRALAGPARLQRYERVQFDLVIAPTQGRGTHEVDFQTVRLDRHHWLYVRAGQVQRWGRSSFEGDLIVLQPAIGTEHWQPGPGGITFTDAQLADVAPLLAFAKLERKHHDPVVMERTRELHFHWLRLGDDRERDPICIAFTNLLETRAVDLRNVKDYAALLGHSKRDLVASCRKSGSGHPQQMIDAAVVLEAKRLLIEPNGTIPVVASFLGFSRSEFEKFFKKVEGRSVSKWAAQHLKSFDT